MLRGGAPLVAVRDPVTGAASAQQPLHAACLHNQLLAAKWLVDHGSPLDATTHGGMTPMHAACAAGHLVMAEWLYACGVPVNTPNDSHQVPLHFACGNAHLHVCRWLHARGAHLDALEVGGFRPIHFACATGAIVVVEWLRDGRQHRGARRPRDAAAPHHVLHAQYRSCTGCWSRGWGWTARRTTG